MIDILLLAIAIGCLGFGFHEFLDDMAFRFGYTLLKPLSCSSCLAFWLALGVFITMVFYGWSIMIVPFAGISFVTAALADKATYFNGE